MENVNEILKELEGVARGKKVDEKKLLEQTKIIYYWAKNDLNATDFLERMCGD